MTRSRQARAAKISPTLKGRMRRLATPGVVGVGVLFVFASAAFPAPRGESQAPAAGPAATVEPSASGEPATGAEEVVAGDPAAAAEADDFTLPEGLRRGWYARIETSKGRIIARLFPDQAPQSVAHFVGMAEGSLGWNDPATGEYFEGHYYDGVPVQRAEAGQRFEIGDRTSPTGDGTPEMYVDREGSGPRNFAEGFRLGMTRSAGGKVSAIKFFITAAAQPFLNGRYPCFGEVVSGKQVVQAISEVQTYSNGRPLETVLIEKVRIYPVANPKPLAEPKPFWPRLSPFERRDEPRD